MHYEPKLLVIEDEATIRMDMVESLKDLGYSRIESAGSRDNAINLARASDPDLAIVDIRLKSHKDGGIQVGEVLRDELSVPFFFVSGYLADEALYKQAEALDPIGFLAKPFETDGLDALVVRALRFDVGWTHRAHEHARKWLFGPNQTQVIAAVAEVKKILTEFPHRAGESRGNRFERILFHSGVTVKYEIDARVVTITEFNVPPIKPPSAG